MPFKYNKSRKPKRQRKHLKHSAKTYIPKKLYYSDEFHTIMNYTNSEQEALKLLTPPYGDFNSIAISFKLGSTINWSTWVRLFEEVRVNKIYVKFNSKAVSEMVTQDQPSTALTLGDNVPNAYYLLDRTDVAPEPNRNAFMEYNKTVKKKASKNHYISFKPSLLVPCVGVVNPDGSIIYNYTVDYKTSDNWINLSNANVGNMAYYGIKFGMQGSNSQVFQIAPEISFGLSFRGKRQ